MLMTPQCFPFQLTRVTVHFKKPLIILCIGQMWMECWSISTKLKKWLSTSVVTFKLLGVVIGSDFTWNAHVSYILSKCAKHIYCIRNLSKAGVLACNIVYTPCPLSGKKRVYSILGITSSNTGRFSKFFHFLNLLEICNKAVVKYPTSPQTRHCTTLWNIDVIKLACPERRGSLSER